MQGEGGVVRNPEGTVLSVFHLGCTFPRSLKSTGVHHRGGDLARAQPGYEKLHSDCNTKSRPRAEALCSVALSRTHSRAQTTAHFIVQTKTFK